MTAIATADGRECPVRRRRRGIDVFQPENAFGVGRHGGRVQLREIGTESVEVHHNTDDYYVISMLADEES